MEALVMLNDLVDESDPDIALPNIVHAFQVQNLMNHAHPFSLFTFYSNEVKYRALLKGCS